MIRSCLADDPADNDAEAQSNSSPLVSILIVCYSSEDDIHRCLSSLFEHSEHLPIEVLLIDNYGDASEQIVREAFPQVRIVPTRALLLNPDTQLFNDAITPLVDCAKARFDAGTYRYSRTTASIRAAFKGAYRFETAHTCQQRQRAH